jgi:hypothetical protein
MHRRKSGLRIQLFEALNYFNVSVVSKAKIRRKNELIKNPF